MAVSDLSVLQRSFQCPLCRNLMVLLEWPELGRVATDGKIADLTLSRGKPGARPGLSVQTVVGLSSDALLLATTQHQEATDKQRQPTAG